MRRDRNRDEGSDAHPEHELELLLAARAVAERGEHEHEVFEVQVLKHLHDSRRERGYRELGDGQELIARVINSATCSSFSDDPTRCFTIVSRSLRLMNPSRSTS